MTADSQIGGVIRYTSNELRREIGEELRGASSYRAKSVVVPFTRQRVEDTQAAASALLESQLTVLFQESRGHLVRFLAVRTGSEAEAQELAQEAFLKLLKSDGLKHTENLKALLYTTARNLTVDSARRRSLHTGWEREQETSEVDLTTPEQILSDKQQLQHLGKLVNQLPSKCKQAFVSFKIHGMSYPEIAQEMGLTESMVRKYVLRALAHCAQNLDRGGV